jgi:hypothetical protein
MGKITFERHLFYIPIKEDNVFFEPFCDDPNNCVNGPKADTVSLQ